MARNNALTHDPMAKKMNRQSDWYLTIGAIIVVTLLLLFFLTLALIFAATPPYAGAGNVGP